MQHAHKCMAVHTAAWFALHFGTCVLPRCLRCISTEMCVRYCGSVCTWVWQQQTASEVTPRAQSQVCRGRSSSVSILSCVQGHRLTAQYWCWAGIWHWDIGHCSCTGSDMCTEPGQRVCRRWTVPTPTVGESCILWNSSFSCNRWDKSSLTHHLTRTSESVCQRESNLGNTPILLSLRLEGGHIIRAAKNLYCSKHFRAFV